MDMDLFLRICAELGDEILRPPGALPDSVEIQTAEDPPRNDTVFAVMKAIALSVEKE
jgi:hypothetical protein